MSVAVLGLQVLASAETSTPPVSSGLWPKVGASVNYAGHPTINTGNNGSLAGKEDFEFFDDALRSQLGLPSGTKVLAGPHRYLGSFPSAFSALPMAWAYTDGYKFGVQNMKTGDKSSWLGGANGNYNNTLRLLAQAVPSDFNAVFAVDHEPDNDIIQPTSDGGSDEALYAPRWAQMQAQLAGVIASLNLPNVWFAIINMGTTWPISGQPGDLGSNNRNPERWNAYQYMDAATKARTILAPDYYTDLKTAAVISSPTSSSIVIPDAQQAGFQVGHGLFLAPAATGTPTDGKIYKILSKTGGTGNPRTITIQGTFNVTPTAGTVARPLELLSTKHGSIVSYTQAAGWGVQRHGISEHTWNNDVGAPESHVAVGWRSDVWPWFRSLGSTFAYYLTFNTSSGLASGVDGWTDLPGELQAFGEGAQEFNAGGSSTGGTGIAFRDSAAATANNSSPTVTIPTTAQVGDYALLGFSCSSTVTVTDPAGWTVLVSQDAGNVRTRLYGRFLTSGQPGSAVGPAMSATSRWEMDCTVYSGVNATAMDATPVVVTATTANTVQVVGPITTVTAAATVLQRVANRGTVTVNTTAWTPPAGYALRSQVYPTGLPGTSAAVADKANAAVGTYGGDTWTSDASLGSFVGVTLALRPA